jgi:diguanylate cyclase (GGDEF)-like protein
MAAVSNLQVPVEEDCASAASIMSALGIGVALVDARGAVVFSNPLFYELLDAAQATVLLDQARAGREEVGETPAACGSLRLSTRRIGSGILAAVEQVGAAGFANERDLLTGALSREGLASSLAVMQRSGEPIASVITINLDRFRPVNEALGFAVGNELLKTVTRRIQSVLQPGDLLARVSGDDFVVVERGELQPGRAATLAGRLVDLIGRAYIISGQLVVVSGSAGVALCPQDGEDGERLIRNAELALSRAKRAGGNGFQFFEAEMHERLMRRREIETDLRRALALKQFEVHYQPQVNIATGGMTGFEALLRWVHPVRGTVSPAEFVPIAEDLGLIVPIGEWVLRQACAEAARWPGDMTVAVNVSAVQLRGTSLVRTVMSALGESGLRSDRLELEITESVLVEDEGAAVETLHRLRALGVRISMDDFGTGYASLSYLRSFPFDKIKIDQSFVRGADAETSGTMIVRAVAALGRSLGMTTLAEGVETPEQMERIRSGGCTDIQGYLVARPMPASEIENFIIARNKSVGPMQTLRSPKR